MGLGVQGLGFLPPKPRSKGGFLVSFLLQFCCSPSRHRSQHSQDSEFQEKSARATDRGSRGLSRPPRADAIVSGVCFFWNGEKFEPLPLPPWSPNPAAAWVLAPARGAPEELGLKRTQGPKARAPMFMVSGTLASLGFRI